ncbi:hypothetical protein [Paracoccus sp. SM22M-07]|nr:hypothetical protein [Paracoccus sp. SM22M-07]
MKVIVWYLLGRLNEARAVRALALHHRFTKEAEKFFSRIREARHEHEDEK